MSTSKSATIRAFFVNVNKSSVLVIVPEQSKVEIHNVHVPAASNRVATALLPSASTLCSKHDRGRLRN